MSSLTSSQRYDLKRILLSFVLFLGVFLLGTRASFPWYGVLYLVPYLIVGYDVLIHAVRNIRYGRLFDENFLMSIATVGAFCLGEYPEAVAVMVFYQVGELFEGYAVNKSRRSIAALMDIRPDHATVERNGELFDVDPTDIVCGEVIVIRPGDRVPLDGRVISGTSELDTRSITGESLPRPVTDGDEVISGCINGFGLLRVLVTKRYTDSTVAKILELVENAASRKAKTEELITVFARYYTPAVVVIAVLLAFLPPLVFGEPFSEWVSRALIFLVVSCPCALVISIPLSFFGGIGGASRNGILVKGGNYLEALSAAKTVVFDKTGTLTTGTFQVTMIQPFGGFSSQDLLMYTAEAEYASRHPLAAAVRLAYALPVDAARVTDLVERPGLGISATVSGVRVAVGNLRMMGLDSVKIPDSLPVGTVIHTAVEGQYAGYISFSDTLKPNTKMAIEALKKLGIERTVILTGDTKTAATDVARDVGITEVRAELLPQDKVTVLEEIIVENPRGKVVYVGDGINDAPVLSRADVGIAMGVAGSDAAIEAADVVLMDDDPAKVADAVRIAKRTYWIVRENIIFALGIKFLILVAAAFGMANMWEAVFADVGVAVIAVLNAMRCLRVRT